MAQPFLPITHQPNSVRLPEETPNGYQLPQFGLDLLLPTRTVIYRQRPSYGCFAMPITEILNDFGHILYQVKLESWACCDPRRTTVMTDLRTGSEVARFEVEQKCGCICTCFRAPELKVTVREVTTGETLGTVQLDRVSCWRYDFKVSDGAGRLVVRVVNKTEWCTRETYHLLNGDGMVIGRVIAEGHHFYCYRMEFPEGLDVATKATLLAFLNLLLNDNIINTQPVPISISSQRAPQLQGSQIGLEPLLDSTRIRLRQRIQMVKIYCGCDMPINFELINERNQIIFQSEEYNECCVRNCVPQGMRTESVLSNMKRAPILQFQRESRCVLNCCLPCCCYSLPFSKEQLSVVSIAGGGSILGTIRHDWSMWTSKFSVLNSIGEVVARIEGPGSGNFTTGENIEYQILTSNGNKFGSIIKHYGGLVEELCTDFDEFTVIFPVDLDVSVKACLVGAAHLINFLFFEGAFRRILFVAGVCVLR